jgi:hypothetical protein
MENNIYFLLYLAHFFLGSKMLQTKVVEKIKTHILCTETFFLPFFFFRKSCRYKIIWKITVEPDRPQMTMWCMRIARWITKVTETHSEYKICIAFPLQQWLHEGASLLRFTYTVCLVLYSALCQDLLSSFYRSFMPSEIFCAFVMCATCPTHFILLGFISALSLREVYRQ